MRADDLHSLPADLPVPLDDGACDHLLGRSVPAIALPSTAGRTVLLDRMEARFGVVYCYPRTGRLDEDPPGGLAGWNATPGARGCTPQTCAYRDLHASIQALGAEVFGLSTQTTEYQQEMVRRLGVPFEVLSDARLELARALALPTFEVAGQTLLKRLTMIVERGRIVHVSYPVFPPNADAGRALAWLRGAGVAAT